MSAPDGGVKPVVLRATSSAVTFWAVAVISAVFVVDAAVRGFLPLALKTALILGFLVWCAWLLLYRLSIRLDGDALVARNVLRVVRVPWPLIDDIVRGAQIEVTLRDDTHVVCWGSPFPPRKSIRAVRNLRPPVDAGLDAARAAWGRGRGHATDAVVTRGWDVAALTTGVILLIGLVFALTM